MITQEEVKNWVVGYAQAPDQGIESANAFLEQIAEVFDAVDALTAGLEDRDKKIRELQDTNLKLFLSQTGQGEEQEVDHPLTLEELAAKM